MTSQAVPKLPIVFWQPGEDSQNLGDYLSVLIADVALGHPVEDAKSYRVIGSCIADFIVSDAAGDFQSTGAPHIAFWGCGARDDTPLSHETLAKCRFFGVRGPLTRDLLGLPASTPIGDTGLLTPLLHAARLSPTTASRTICVPHINDRKTAAELLRASGADEVVSSEIKGEREALLTTIDAIASADFVLCGALHAAILAHAYDVPFAFWDNGHVDIPFKWRDFAASINIPTVFVRSVDEGKIAYSSFLAPTMTRLPLVPILAAAPFKVKSDVLSKALAHDRRHLARAKTMIEPQHVRTDLNSNHDAEAPRPTVGEAALLQRIETLTEIVDLRTRQRNTAMEDRTVLGAHVDQVAEKVHSGYEAARAQTERMNAILCSLRASAATLESVAAEQARSDADALAQLRREHDGLRDELVEERRRSSAAALERDTVSRRLTEVESELEAARVSGEVQAAEFARLLASSERDARAQIHDARASQTILRSRVETIRNATSRLRQDLDSSREQAKGLATQFDASLQAEAGRSAVLSRRLAVLGLRQVAENALRAARDRAPIVARTALGDPLLIRTGERESSPWPKLTRREKHTVSAELLTWNLFSPDWYRRTYADARHLGDEGALEHFLTYGVVRGRDPHPLFSTSWILANNKAVFARPPLVDYLIDKPSFFPHPLFDPPFYLECYPDVGDAGIDALQHYVRHGAREGRRPHPLFDPEWYRDRRGPDAISANALVEYLTDPVAFTMSPHPLFDPIYYGRQATGLAEAAINPLLHYYIRGEAEGLAPHPLFDPRYYRARYDEVGLLGLNALLHYVRLGAAQRFWPHPLFDADHYADAYPDEPAAGGKVGLEHYVIAGGAERRMPHPGLSLDMLAEAFPSGYGEVGEPIAALMQGSTLSLDVPLSSRPPGVPVLVEEIVRAARQGSAMPDRLRLYLADRFGSDAVNAIGSLMELLDRYGNGRDSFRDSRDFWDLSARISFAAGDLADDVDVSIVVPVHNQLIYTMTCVAALLEGETRYTYEILIGDDASTDDTASFFSRVGGRVKLIHHADNKGFLGNCNATAQAARGRYLLFLNNDTLPLPGWLDALVDLADRTPEVGVVGSKLLNADGTLQEAGGIIWKGGSPWNYGRNGDPDAPAYNYVKDVDYCSGASILVPHEVWRELDGFDTAFAPAYCEDSDFAFRARAARYRTLYQPFSEIIHHEGRSHGTDTNAGIKAFQVINSHKFVERWAAEIDRFHFDNAENVEQARDRSREQPRILIVDHYIPQWDRDAGSRTMLHFIRLFVENGFRVTFWPDNLFNDRDYARGLQEIGVEVLYGVAYLDKFDEWIAARGHWLDYVLLSRPHISEKYIDTVRNRSQALVVYYGHDLHWMRLQDEFELTGSEKARALSLHMRAVEGRMAVLSDVVMYPSERERERVAAEVGHDKAVVAVPAWLYAADELAAARVAVGRVAESTSDRILFVGGFNHPPNADAVLWFVQDVLPAIRERRPDTRLTIVGSNPTSEILGLARDDIEITGQVSDAELARHYTTCGVAVVPLRVGGGVKGKVIEAFSKAVPVVCTPVGAQGIPEADALAFVASTAAEFAHAVCCALENRALAEAKARRAVAFLAREYSPAKIINQLSPYVPELGLRRTRDAIEQHASETVAVLG